MLKVLCIYIFPPGQLVLFVVFLNFFVYIQGFIFFPIPVRSQCRVSLISSGSYTVYVFLVAKCVGLLSLSCRLITAKSLSIMAMFLEKRMWKVNSNHLCFLLSEEQQLSQKFSSRSLFKSIGQNWVIFISTTREEEEHSILLSQHLSGQKAREKENWGRSGCYQPLCYSLLCQI